jgi:hypothetical protein
VRILLPLALLASTVAVAQKSDSPAGVWRGESKCTADASSSCHDEKVVYYIDPIPDKPDAMMVRADKIVDGQAITMGTGPWQYDPAKHSLTWEVQKRVWLMVINGREIEGKLTMPDKTVFRRMKLTKDG